VQIGDIDSARNALMGSQRGVDRAVSRRSGFPAAAQRGRVHTTSRGRRRRWSGYVWGSPGFGAPPLRQFVRYTM
jgi:hypothetical protein